MAFIEKEKKLNYENYKLLSKLVDIQQGRYVKADSIQPNSHAAITN